MPPQHSQSYALFDTAIGVCGIVWSQHGVLGFQLPEQSVTALRKTIGRRFAEATEQPPPKAIARYIERVVSHLAGERSELDEIVLDMHEVSPFYRRVYEAARRVPSGKTCSYGELAERLGAPGAARAVGQALGKNPFAIIVPCHRVMAKNGKIGGFSAHGGVATKRRLLLLEQRSVRSRK